MVNFLFVLSGVCWTLVYISLIYRGFKDKTYGMPLFALGLNIAWEVLYSIDGIFIHKANMPPVQNVANVVWAFFDILIVITFFRYGKKYFPEIGKKYFLPFGTLAIFTCVALQLAFYLHFDSGVEASQYYFNEKERKVSHLRLLSQSVWEHLLRQFSVALSKVQICTSCLPVWYVSFSIFFTLLDCFKKTRHQRSLFFKTQ